MELISSEVLMFFWGFFAAVTLTLSALIEGKRLNQPCHKFGVGLEFEF